MEHLEDHHFEMGMAEIRDATELCITVTLYDEDQAMALAQFLKRLGWNEIRVNAVSDDDAYLMREALGRVRRAVNDAGFDPR